jgi:hypothetical protein
LVLVLAPVLVLVPVVVPGMVPVVRLLLLPLRLQATCCQR